MEYSVKISYRVLLELNQEEAVWLKDCLQNSLYPDEVAEDAEMRKRFFDAITACLKLKDQ